jgi:hypothetical protein
MLKTSAITIKISPAELERVNDTSIALTDGSGYIAETAVYHELHCIVCPNADYVQRCTNNGLQKRIRRHLFLSHYYPNMTEDQRLREGPHAGELDNAFHD